MLLQQQTYTKPVTNINIRKTLPFWNAVLVATLWKYANSWPVFNNLYFI